MNVSRSLYLTGRFFYAAGFLILLMVLSYAFPVLFPITKTACILFLLVCVIDAVLLYSKKTNITVERSASPVLSLGDDNEIEFSITNQSRIPLRLELIDELPEQFQKRDFVIRMQLAAGATEKSKYVLRPLTRGEYSFGKVQAYIISFIGILKKRISTATDIDLPVYPSILQMKRYELKTFAKTATEYGIKKVRRIGHSYEFEHIKQYNRGDDYRSINWKATGRRAQLMVNQYEDEKSQQVYSIVDKSRVMHMPFGGMSLFDYAVNASLVISNIVLGKHDKAGLITFADKPKALVKADRSKKHLKRILETLYNEKEGAVEANYEGLYQAVRGLVKGRSLLFLYTNFESTYALHRALPQLRKLNDQHLLVVIFFENTEIRPEASKNVETLEDIYAQVTAETYLLTKVQLAQQLKQFGIISILSKPENLTVNTINKYLELKSRGMI